MSRLAGEPRHLKAEEIEFIATIIRRGKAGDRLISQLPECWVREMSDGAMGSLQFVSSKSDSRKLGRALAEVWFKDRDGVWVSAVLNLDDQDDLYELDLWKTDFSRLIALPQEGEIVGRCDETT